MAVRDNKVILAIRGLDKLGVDPNNIKIVDSLDAEEEEEEGSTDGLKKLKLVSLPSHKKNFKKEGIFGEKFRLPYTRKVIQGQTSSRLFPSSLLRKTLQSSAGWSLRGRGATQSM